MILMQKAELNYQISKKTLMFCLKEINKTSKFFDGIELPKIKVLGNGANGIAYKLNEDYVLKITKDLNEVKFATFFMDKNIKHLVKVHKTFKFYDEKNYLFSILMDFVEKVTDGDLKVETGFYYKEYLYENKKTHENKKIVNILNSLHDQTNIYNIDRFLDVKQEHLGKDKNGEYVFFDLFYHEKNKFLDKTIIRLKGYDKIYKLKNDKKIKKSVV